MARTVDDVIRDLRKEAQFQDSVGSVMSVIIIDEAIHLIRRQAKELERLKENGK